MGNAQGGYYFLLLATGRKLSRKQWDILSMPDKVIAAVESMVAQVEQQQLIGYGAPLFEWIPGVALEDEMQAPILQVKGDDGNDHMEVIEGDNEGVDEIVFDEETDSEEDRDSYYRNR